MAKFRNTNIIMECYIVNLIIIILNLSVFFFYVWNGMLYTKYIIVFSLENSFPIVLSGEV
jgi:hypothetical protein